MSAALAVGAASFIAVWVSRNMGERGSSGESVEDTAEVGGALAEGPGPGATQIFEALPIWVWGFLIGIGVVFLGWGLLSILLRMRPNRTARLNSFLRQRRQETIRKLEELPREVGEYTHENEGDLDAEDDEDEGYSEMDLSLLPPQARRAIKKGKRALVNSRFDKMVARRRAVLGNESEVGE